MKKLAIFDFDGTLFDTIDDVVECFNRALSQNGFPSLTYEEYLEILPHDIDEAASMMLKNLNTPENIETLQATYKKLYDESLKENTRPFPDAHEILKELQDRGMLLAINSNRKNDSISYFVDKYFNDIDFAAIEGYNPDYPSKPRRHAINRIMDKFGVSKAESVYIGDTSTDIETSLDRKSVV